MSLCSIGIIKPDQFVNMMSPLFVGNKKLKLVLHQLRTILHIPLHYFHSTPLYAPFLSDLSTCDKNMNLSLRATAEQYSQIVDFNNAGTKIRMNPYLSNKTPSVSPKKSTQNSTLSSSKSASVSANFKAAMIGSGSVSYRQNPHYKKNMLCSSKQAFHLRVINDEYASRSTGAENNPENDHMTNRNKHEIELNDKEHIMTLWDYYVEQNSHAIQCLKRLESRILYLYKEYKKLFIIRDDYDSLDSNDDDKNTVVDETNLHFYDSDTYTTVTEEAHTDSDISLDDDNHSTTSEPLRHRNNRNSNSNVTVGGHVSSSPRSVNIPFPRKSTSMGGLNTIPSIPEHKSMMENNDSDGTVMTARSDGRLSFPKVPSRARPKRVITIAPKPVPKPKAKRRLRRKRNLQKTETDKKYVLSRIYADIDMDYYLTPVCWSALRRLYEEHFDSVRAAFKNNPLSAINVVLPRLQRKQKEWSSNRKIAQEIYRDVATRNCMKALDWQPKYKRLDKTRLSHNELWRELITAQSVLNPQYAVIIEGERQKRSGLKDAQREQFNKPYSPMDGASSIKPTRLIRQHFTPKVATNSTIAIARRLEGKHKHKNSHNRTRKDSVNDVMDVDGESDEDIKMADGGNANHKKHKFDFRMNIYYNYGLRFDLKNNDFESVINLPLTSHEHCWNVIVQYLSTENKHKKIKDQMLEDVIKFYSNFLFLLFEFDIFHEELLPSKIFEKLSFKMNENMLTEAGGVGSDESVVKFDDLCKLKYIGLNIGELRFKPLVFDYEYFGKDIDLNNVLDDNVLSYHNRISHVIFVNREIYNILRLYIHLFQRLQKARDLSTNRWRLNFDALKKEENELRQEKNEREFYGKLMALIQGQIKDTEFDAIVQQLFGPEGYECSNIKYLIKNLCVSMQNILICKKNKQKRSGRNKTWEILKLWHFYYAKWKEIDVNNIKQRIALLRIYYGDIRNILGNKECVVMIEYFLDSKEIGVQFLGENTAKMDNDYVQSNAVIRSWQTPLKQHNSYKHVRSVPFLRKKLEKLEKYRIKKQNKSNNNSNNKKSASYKRISTTIDNVSMYIFEAYSKRTNRKKGKQKAKKNEDLLFLMRRQNLEMNNNNNHNDGHEYTSDDSNLSKSKRKRKRKHKNKQINGHLPLNNGHISNEQKTQEKQPHNNDKKNLSLWYHPSSLLYFQSVNLSKVSKRSKPLHKNRISVSKYDKKVKKFNIWHEKRFKDLERSQHLHLSASKSNKYTFSPHLNGNHAKNNLFGINTDHLLTNNSALRSHNNSPYSTNTSNIVNSALNSMMPQTQNNVSSLLQGTNTNTNIQQLINNNNQLSLNNSQSINNLLINNISADTYTANGQTAQSNGNSAGIYSAALNASNGGVNALNIAQQQAAAQQYYASYRSTADASGVPAAHSQASNVTPTQYTVTTNYPSAYAAYGQYAMGTTPTGYVAIQQQGVPSHGNTSYVMDNRTGSIYAAIPAPQHYATTANGMGVYAAAPQTQYVSIPTANMSAIAQQGIQQGMQQHIVQGANGQSAVVLTQNNQNSGNANPSPGNGGGANVSVASGGNNTMSTPPNITVTDKGNNTDGSGGNNSNNNGMQLPVLNAAVRNNSTDTSCNNKSDVK